MKAGRHYGVKAGKCVRMMAGLQDKARSGKQGASGMQFICRDANRAIRQPEFMPYLLLGVSFGL